VSNSSSNPTALSATPRAKKHQASLDRECPDCHYAKYPNSGLCTNPECPQYHRSNRAMTSDELLREFEPPRLFPGRKWGRWVLDTERLVLVLDGEGQVRGDGSGVTVGTPRYVAFIGKYELDLEQVSDSAGLLDMLFQVARKGWATARVTRDLLSAIESIFRPQRNLCSGGCSKTISSPKDFLRNRFATAGVAS
jgi:hypothetical protein